MAKHNMPLVIAVVIGLILSILTPIFYILVTRDVGRHVFVKKLEYETFDYQPLGITPPRWIHGIWEFCMWCQPSWLFSTLIYTMLRDKNNDFLYKRTPIWGVIFFSLACVFQVIRYFCFGHRIVVGSLVAAILGLVAAIISLVILTMRPKDWPLPAATRTRQGNLYSAFITRCWTINAMGAYCTWSFLYTMFHLSTVMAYEVPKEFDAEKVAIGGLAVILLLTLVYFFVDLCFCDAYNRFQVAPYTLMMIGMAALLTSPHQSQQACRALTAIILTLSVLGLLFKIVFIIIREVIDVKQPPKQTKI